MIKQKESDRLLKKAIRCKPKELKALLKQVEIVIEKSEGKNKDLIFAKIIITTRLTSWKIK